MAEIDWYALAQSVVNHPHALPAVITAQGAALIFLGLYVTAKFRRMKGVFTAFSQQWSTAESTHQSLLQQARDQFNNLSSTRPVTREENSAFAAAPVNAAVRGQVAAMLAKGMAEPEIARICGMPEGAVRVLAGFARLQQPEAS